MSTEPDDGRCPACGEESLAELYADHIRLVDELVTIIVAETRERRLREILAAAGYDPPDQLTG